MSLYIIKHQTQVRKYEDILEIFNPKIVKSIHTKINEAYVLNSVTMMFDSQAARVGLHDVGPTCNMNKYC